MSRAIGVTNLTKRPSARTGARSIAVPLSFDPADMDTNNTFRFDLTQEMQTGQFETPQALYLDNTLGGVDIQLFFQETNQYVRFPVRSLAILPYLGQSFGPVFARYQTVAWNSSAGFYDAGYKPVLYILNTATPFGIWNKPQAYEDCWVYNQSNVCTGGFASDIVIDATVNNLANPETRIWAYLENPITEVEPLFWRVQGTASATRARLMPGEHIQLGQGSPMSQGSIQVAAATAGHTYKAYVGALV